MQDGDEVYHKDKLKAVVTPILAQDTLVSSHANSEVWYLSLSLSISITIRPVLVKNEFLPARMQLGGGERELVMVIKIDLLALHMLSYFIKINISFLSLVCSGDVVIVHCKITEL